MKKYLIIFFIFLFPILAKTEVINENSTLLNKDGTAKEEKFIDLFDEPVDIVDETDYVLDDTDLVDIISPTVINAKSLDKDTLQIEFSEDIILPKEDKEKEFIVTEELNKDVFLDILSVQLKEQENNIVILKTSVQKEGTNYTVTVSPNITDLSGMPIISGITDTATFMRGKPDNIDKISPEDITNFLITFNKQFDKYLLRFAWIPSLNTAGDLIDQILYMSLDKGKTYKRGISLGPETNTYQMKNIEGGRTYTFKITTKDINGNESKGVIKSVTLPKTGPIMIISVLTSVLIGGSISIARKRKKQKT